MNPNEGNPAPTIPHGAMVLAGIEHIDDGAFLSAINDALREAHAAIAKAREKTGSSSVSAGVSISLTVGYDKDIRDIVEIRGDIRVKVPSVSTAKSLVKERAGRMLCQPTGADATTPDQLRLFNPSGSALGTFVRGRGLVKDGEEETGVAGSIGSAAG